MSKNNSEVLLQSQNDIIDSWSNLDVVTSIICTTYNHANYVDDTIKGFLMQKTSHPFEIIIHDDASTDSTRDIIERYRKKYDKIIKVIYQDENQYSKNVNIPLRLSFEMAAGEYIAFCEGDDFWFNEKKLENQLQVFKENKDIGLVITDFHILYQDHNKIKEACFYNQPHKFPFCSTFEAFILGRSYMAPCTWLLKKELFYKAKYETLDATFSWLLDILKDHKIYLLPEATTTYRVLNESASHSTSFSKMLVRENDIFEIQKNYIKKYKVNQTIYNKVLLKHTNKTLHLNIVLDNKDEVLKARKIYRNLSFRSKVLCLISYFPLSKSFIKIAYKYKNLFK